MAEIVIVGGGVAGLTASMLLARDGHHVTLVERDPGVPPADPTTAWDDWERRGVNQFRLPHSFLPRFRAVLDDELPDLPDVLVGHGALRLNRMQAMPDTITGGFRPGDERFEVVTGRRPMIEAAMALAVAQEDGVVVRRGVAVRGLTVAADGPGHDGVPHVTGIVTDRGERIPADLVVDCGGRRSALADWLADAGARRPVDDAADAGFIYFSRHFRSSDGTTPAAFGPPIQPYDSLSMITLAADNGHWSVVVLASAADKAMRAVRDIDVWHRLVARYPLVAHWVDAEPTTGVDVFARIEDRVRHMVVDGRPVATGVVAVGDAWACTNPSVGRGSATAALHAVALRDALRDASAVDARALVDRFDAITRERVAPFVDDTLRVTRHRLAQIDAQIAGRPYETDDAGWHLGQALMDAAAHDPELLRGAMDVGSMLARGIDVLHRPGLVDRLRAIGPVAPLPGPARAEVVDVIGAGRDRLVTV
ncbi:MAG: FAD-dependent oxidoreductase [Ilumatobacteraceae bacterium]